MATKEDAQKSKLRFQEGERILCFHGPLIYEAKCLKTRVTDKGVCEYLVHYAGWNKSWDEWMNDLRILKYSEQNLIKQKTLLKAHKDAKKIRCKATLSASSGTVTSVLSGTSYMNSSNAKNPSQENEVEKLDDASVDETEPTRKKSRIDLEVETEEQLLDKVEVKVKLPEELNPFLVDDWDLVCRQKKLVCLPAKTTVDDIVENYIKQKASAKNNNPGNRENAAIQTANGIKEYFNATLGSQLLYKYERVQYAEILDRYPDKPLSSIYGAPHVLRLFVILGSLLVYTSINEKTVQLLQTQLQDFLRYLVKNSSTLFNVQNYGHATAEYQRKSST